jgi:hypothetical protein
MPPVAGAVVTALAAVAAEPPTAPDPDAVSPGLGGFLVVFALALATWFLARSMTGRLRNVRRRAELEEREGRPPEAADGDEGRGDAAGAGGSAGRPPE